MGSTLKGKNVLLLGGGQFFSIMSWILLEWKQNEIKMCLLKKYLFTYTFTKKTRLIQNISK